MSEQLEFPALSDDELRETLDLLATAVASISDRVDDQTRMLDRVNKSATEARTAAFAARKQTDPENYGKLVAKTIDGQIGETLQRMEILTNHLELRTNQAVSVLDQASQDRGKALRDLHAREQTLETFKRRLPWLGLGALVVALAMTVTLPRFMAGHAATCAVLGASWTTTTTGVDACVFYQR
jgi:uncharacterized membrane protein